MIVMGIVNARSVRQLPAMTDGGTYIHAGPEIGVASTKAFTSQVTALALTMNVFESARTINGE